MMMAMTKTELVKLLHAPTVRSHFGQEPIYVNIARPRRIRRLSCPMKVILLLCLITNSFFDVFFCVIVGRDWKCRAPPRGYTADTYTLCESFMENLSCHYGNQCVEAHGNEELHEWQERFEYRKMRMQRACEKELFGKSFTEQLLEKWVSDLIVNQIS